MGGRAKIITLRRQPQQSLGLSIVGPGYIRAIHAGSVAAEDGRLHKKDQIIKINGQSVLGLDHDEIIAALRNAPDTVTLSVVTPDKKDAKGSSKSSTQPSRRETPQKPPASGAPSSRPQPLAAVEDAEDLPPPPQKPPRRGDGTALGPPRQVVLAKSSAHGLGFSVAAAPNGGVCVSDVVQGAPADKAGLMAHDVLLAADGHDLSAASPKQTRALLSASGAKVQLVVATPERLTPSMRRKATGKENPTVASPPSLLGPSVDVALWPPYAAAVSRGPLVTLELHRSSARKLGVILAGGTDKHLGGAFVTYVPPDTPAAAAGFCRGDRVLRVDAVSTEVGGWGVGGWKGEGERKMERQCRRRSTRPASALPCPSTNTLPLPSTLSSRSARHPRRGP